MYSLRILLIPCLLLAAPAGPLSARTTLIAAETSGDETTARILELAAPLLGIGTTSVQSAYEAGQVTITDQGPIRGGCRYLVGGPQFDFVIIDDIIAG